MDDIEQRQRTIARLLIKLSGTTLARLAYATGVTGNTISRWVHGDRCALGPQGRDKLFTALGAHRDGLDVRLAPRASGAAQPVFQINGLVQAERFATLAALTSTRFVAARETCQGKTLVSVVTDISGQTTALLVGTREALDALYTELGITVSSKRRLEVALGPGASVGVARRLHSI
ncbi:hypothetical protein PEP31012_02659 [Pandoraea eparura]|uniref:Uncharacterized protein n=1 Tax=Pandoraea eparura TaxID=2508291 RepID=A0A5E4VKF4_9BURK|nr:hypothetical protein [Pandoraea eparura]VVE11545.1 hypothetical protein PEP31012_02659 [Pandoraea eparura]